MTGCPTPEHDHAVPGDRVRLGTCIGHALEPGERWGRLVAIRHHEEGMQRYILREYRDGDGAWPTGKHFCTWLIVPHTYREESTDGQSRNAH